MVERFARPSTTRQVAGAAVLCLVLLELARVWFPAVLVVFGDAGRTSALLLAPLGLLPLLLPSAIVGALARTRHRPRDAWLIAGTAATLGRAALLVTDGGYTQAIVAGTALAATGMALVALTDATAHHRAVRSGAFLGLAGATLVHTANRSVDIVWATTPVRWGVGGALVLALGLVTVMARPAPEDEAAVGRPPSSDPRAWWLLAPTFVLLGVLAGAPGRVALATGWSPWQVAAVIAALHVLGVLAAVAVPLLGPARAGWSGAVLVLAGTAASLDAGGPLSVAALGALLIGLGLLIGIDVPTGVRQPTSERAARATAGALAAVPAIVAAYYAGYDLRLPIANRWVLLAVAGAVALHGVGTALRTATTTPGSRLLRGAALRATAAGTLVVVIVAAAAAGGQRPAPERVTGEDEVRIALYNVRFGYDLDGDLALREQAAVLRRASPDIVVLNEVDRGWLSSGSHDVLTLLAAQLGYEHVRFAPAADEVWGNAVLSRFPIREFASERLPKGTDPMARGQFAAILAVGDDRELGVVGAHLSHVGGTDTRLPQARAVAATVAQLRERGLPTVMAGDLNAGHDAAEVQSFAPLLDNALPSSTGTYPADRPRAHVDHILTSPELRLTEMELPETLASDHRPVIATFRFER